MRERQHRRADREHAVEQPAEHEPRIGKATRVADGDDEGPPRSPEAEQRDIERDTERLATAIARGDFAQAVIAASALRAAVARVGGEQRAAHAQLERAPRLDREVLREGVAGTERERWRDAERAWLSERGLPVAPEQDAIAEAGLDGAGSELPFRSEIQASFGRHDISAIRTAIGGRASAAASRLGARAYAYGDRIAFASSPDLHTAAHEAAHVIQQRAGVALAGGAGADVHEAQADEVADLVVASRSAESVLDRIAGTGRGAAPVVQRKESGAQAPVGDRKYTVRYAFEWPLPFPKQYGDAKFQVRWEIAIARKGLASGPVGPIKVQVGTMEAVKDHKVTAAATSASQTIKNALGKLGSTLLGGDGDVELLGMPVSLKLETKILEAELALDKPLKLSALKAALVGEADFGGLPEFHRLGEQVSARAQLRIEITIPAELVHDLYRAAQATRSLKRAAEVESRLGEARRRLAKHQKSAADLAARGRLGPKEAARMKHVLAEVDELERTVGKLQRLRAGAVRARAKALHVLATVGGKLRKTALGRVLATTATKAFGKALGHFLPFYNAVATAQDVYALAEFLVNADWSKLGDGKAGLGTAGGEGHEGMGGGDGEDHEEPLGTADLEEPGKVELTPAAAQVVSPLVDAAGGSDARPLDDDAKEIINACVPADLSPEELAEIGAMLGSPGPSNAPLAQAVIAAVQTVRPDGVPRATSPGPTRPQSDAAPQAQPAPKDGATSRAPTTKPKGNGTHVVDVRGYLLANVSVDPATHRVEIPRPLAIGGVVFEVQHATHGWSMATERDTIVVELRVLSSPAEGAQLADGTPLQQGVTHTEVFDVPARVLVSPHP